jgi:hypothetical protein
MRLEAIDTQQDSEYDRAEREGAAGGGGRGSERE